MFAHPVCSVFCSLFVSPVQQTKPCSPFEEHNPFEDDDCTGDGGEPEFLKAQQKKLADAVAARVAQKAASSISPESTPETQSSGEL